MKLRTERGPEVAVVNWSELRTAVAGLNDRGNSFAVIERPDGWFVQTAVTNSGMAVEKGEGSLDRHFRAEQNGSQNLTHADAEAVFRAFYEGSPMAIGIRWVTFKPQVMSKGVWWLLWSLPWLAIAWLVYELTSDSVSLWDGLR